MAEEVVESSESVMCVSSSRHGRFHGQSNLAGGARGLSGGLAVCLSPPFQVFPLELTGITRY
jgi:hypothetical protein